MQFGLLYEAQRPFQGTSVDWNTLYKETLCIKSVRLYEEAGVDQVILITQTKTIPHERALESIEMFGRHVIPACRAGARARLVPAGV